jgi:hypothetical protein
MTPTASSQNPQEFYSLNMAGFRELSISARRTETAVLRTGISKHFTKELGRTASWSRE